MVSIKHATTTATIGGTQWNEDHTVPVASQAEAEAGAATDKLMTPQRTAQAIAALAGGSGVILGLHDFWQETWFSANGATSPDRWTGAAISSGTNNTAPTAASIGGKFRHGVFLRSSTTANGGYRYQTSVVAGDIFGQVSHKFQCAFKWLTSFTGRTVYIGFHDTSTSADAVDGAYFHISGDVCSVKTANNSTRTTNATTLTLSLDIAYVFDIEVNAAGTSARFRVFNGETGASLMDVTNTANIPTSTARSFGSGIVATESSTTASDIGILYLLAEGTVDGYAAATIGVKGDQGDPGPAGGGLLATIVDEKTSGTNGGASTTDYSTRTLNTVAYDPGSIVTLSSNTFASDIDCGVTWSTPALGLSAEDHKSRLVRVSDGAVIAVGTGERVNATSNRSTGSARIQAGVSYRIEHRMSAVQTFYGFGVAVSFGDPEIYTIVNLWR